MGSSKNRKKRNAANTKPAARKKRGGRLKTKPEEHGIFDNVEIAAAVFPFLNIRELFNFAMSSKQFMERLEYKHVVRSAMMSGGHEKTDGHAKSTVQRLMPLIEEDRTIFTPSPLRVLRLVNGKRCEKCLTRKVNMINEHFGVFFCFKCIQKSTVPFNRDWIDLVQHPRVAKNRGFLWNVPVIDEIGDDIGPLVTEETIRSLWNSCSSIDRYLEQQRIDTETDKAASLEIIEVYDESFDDAKRRKEEKQLKEKEATVKANSDRKTKTEAWIKTLSGLLGDKSWKAFALDHKYSRQRYSSRVVAQFKCELTEELLGCFATAPSKATKKELKESAGVLIDSFDPIWSSGFHDLSFLNEKAEKDAYHKALAEEFATNREETHSIMLCISWSTVDLIKSGKLMEAFHAIVSLRDLGSHLAPTVAASASHLLVGRLDALKLKKRCIQLSTRLWGSDLIPQGATPSERFDVSVELLPTLCQNILDFFEDPITEALRGDFGLSFASDIKMVWSGDLGLIRDRKFEAYMSNIHELLDMDDFGSLVAT